MGKIKKLDGITRTKIGKILKKSDSTTRTKMGKI